MLMQPLSAVVFCCLVFGYASVFGQIVTSLYDTIRNNVNTTKFADLLDNAEMKPIMSKSTCPGTDTQCMTIFAPDNNAVTAMSAALNWDSLIMASRKKIISGHIFEGSKPVTAAEWLNLGVQLNLDDVGFGKGRKNTFALSSIRYAFSTQVSRSSLYFINSASLIGPDLKATNGMVHVIDRMLYTPKAFMPLIDYLLEQADTKVSANFWMTISMTSSNENTYGTYFVVTDQAWAKVPQDKMALLQKNTTLLTEVLSHQYLPNQLVYSQWTSVRPQISLKSGFPNEPSVGDTAKLRPSMLTRSLNGDVFINSGLSVARVTSHGEDIMRAIVHKIDSPLGFVYENREEVVRRLNSNFWQACSTDVNCNAMVTGQSQLTFFVPNVQSWTRFSGLTAEQKTLLLKYMVLPGLIDREQMTSTRTIQIGDQPFAIRFRIEAGTVFVEGSLPSQGYVGVQLLSANNVATNGVAHLVDGIPGLPFQTIEQYLAQTPGFSKYSGYQFVQAQTTGGPYIFLAPTNQALQEMEANTAVGARLLQQVERRSYIFRRHTFPIVTTFESLTPANYLVPTGNYAFTREEMNLSIKVPNNQREFIFSFGGISTVISSSESSQFTNGLLYKLDRLLYVAEDLTRNLCTNSACP